MSAHELQLLFANVAMAAVSRAGDRQVVGRRRSGPKPAFKEGGSDHGVVLLGDMLQSVAAGLKAPHLLAEPSELESGHI